MLENAIARASSSDFYLVNMCFVQYIPFTIVGLVCLIRSLISFDPFGFSCATFALIRSPRFLLKRNSSRLMHNHLFSTFGPGFPAAGKTLF